MFLSRGAPEPTWLAATATGSTSPLVSLTLGVLTQVHHRTTPVRTENSHLHGKALCPHPGHGHLASCPYRLAVLILRLHANGISRHRLCIFSEA